MKKRIAVIFGGCSPEYPVSLQSAYAVLNGMDQKKYTPVLIGITKSGNWLYFAGDTEKIADDTWHEDASCVPAAISPSRSRPLILKYQNGRVEELPIDAAFPILHGKNGEDGTVQGMFEVAGIPVVGCKVLSSALCMNKAAAHRFAGAAGIRVPYSYTFDRTVDEKTVFQAAEKLGFPLFVKPVRAGSSLGVTKVSEKEELFSAVHQAFLYDELFIMEENITGFEVGCAVLGNKDGELTVGEVDEVELPGGFFDYGEKYISRTAKIHVPARLDRDTVDRIRQTAVNIYKILDCRGFARVDMFLSDSGELVFNEVNTIPGFTKGSRFPGMLKAAGMSFEQIVAKVIELAVET